MAATNINRVVLTGNLTRDPELRSSRIRNARLQPAHRVQLAAQGERRVGRQAQLLQRDGVGRAGRELRALPVRGRPVCIDGRLEWREWQTSDGQKREAIEIVADAVQFLGGREDGAGGGGNGMGAGANNGFAPHSDVPADTSDFAPVGGRNSAPADDDIPF